MAHPLFRVRPQWANFPIAGGAVQDVFAWPIIGLVPGQTYVVEVVVRSGANVNVTKPVALAVDVDGFVRAIFDPVAPDALVDGAIRALSEPLPAAARDASASS